MPGSGSVACPKPEPSIYGKQQAKRDLAKLERDVRLAVRKRDKGKCVVPGCKESSRHLHHIVFRSRGGKWDTRNICSLCPAHHALVHAHRITIAGNADEHLEIQGDRKDLEFKL
jgi:5-methylcytosine-specific restriction endonuclease McrA